MALCSQCCEEAGILSLGVCLFAEKRNSTSLNHKRPFLYVKVVHNLLTTYITDDIIYGAIRDLKLYKQTSSVPSTAYAKGLYRLALRCDVYQEKKIKSLFGEGLEYETFGNMRVYWMFNPRPPRTDLAR